MNIIVCKPYCEAEVVKVEAATLPLKMLQFYVDGYIEIVHPDGLPDYAQLVCNEEMLCRQRRSHCLVN